ncbi:MAG: FecR domain-containing protein [Myxococcota bacterium]
MSEPASDRSRHVPVDVSEARIMRLWGGVSARLEQPKRGYGRWLVVGTAAFGVAVLVGVVRFRGTEAVPQTSVWEGALLETAADRMSVSLVDGSKLTLDPSSRVAVQDRSASAVKLVLEQGRLACDVTHRPGRSFVVMAGGVEVRVVGTMFSVTRERAEGALRVAVQVERGVVEVRSPGERGEVTRVEAGHGWSQLTRTETPSATGSAPSLPPPQVSASPEEQAGPEPERADPAPVAGRKSSKPSDAPSDATEARAASAKELFEQASGLWREGRAAEAAQAYQSFLSTYPRDARAGLAAFELGRLRMDRLSDLPGALRALERAVALAPGSGFREDALARIVTASASLGQVSRCSSARERYLREYPNGVHRQRVAKACGGS